MFNLKENQLARYYQDGVIGPLRATSCQTSTSILSEMSIINEDVSPIYGVRTNRDRHLFKESLFDLATSHRIICAEKSILGENIVLFRSDFFKKIPTIGVASVAGGGNTQGIYDTKFEYLHWHQGTNFSGSTGTPSLGHPKTKGEKYSDYYEAIPTVITVWVSLTASTQSNGAVQYWRASDKMGAFKFRPCKAGDGLGGSDFELDVDPPEPECITFETKPGECVIFNNKVVHRSACNMSNESRVGVGFRYTTSDIDIYSNMDVDPYGLRLSSWGAVPVSGRILNPKLRVASLSF